MSNGPIRGPWTGSRRARSPWVVAAWSVGCMGLLSTVWSVTSRVHDRQIMRTMIQSRIDDAKRWLDKGNEQEAVGALNDVAWWVEHNPDDQQMADGIRDIFKQRTQEID